MTDALIVLVAIAACVVYANLPAQRRRIDDRSRR